MIKNTLGDLNNILFEQIDRINDDSLKGDKLNEQLKKSKAINDIANTLVQSGNLMLKNMQFREEIGEVIDATPRLLENE